jgi:hypothetical protein
MRTKCGSCGLVCFTADTNCRRCGSALEEQAQYPMEGQIHGSNSVPWAPAYAIPQSGTVRMNPQSQTHGIWRKDSILVFQKFALLPDRCIKCNQPTGGLRVNKKVSWHNPWLALLIFAGFLVYAVVALVVRKSASLSLGFCEFHKSQRTKMLVAGWLLFILSLVVFVAAIAAEQAPLAYMGVALLLAAVVAATMGGRFIQVKKIDSDYVWLKAIHPQYLDQFPSL